MYADSTEVMIKTMEGKCGPGVIDGADHDRDATLVSRTTCPVPEGRALRIAYVRGAERWMCFLWPGGGRVEGMGDIATKHMG